ncbi:unnamed protein product [Calypogeia fissa]
MLLLLDWACDCTLLLLDWARDWEEFVRTENNRNGMDRECNVEDGSQGFVKTRGHLQVLHLPMVLKTPIEKKGEGGKVVEDKGVWATEIKLLERLIGADTESEEFKTEEQRLHDLGTEERKKFQHQVDKKVQKTMNAFFKKASPKKKKKKAEDEVGPDAE